MNSNKCALSIWLSLILCCIAFPVLAQQSTGTIEGRVTDQNGDLLPGTTVSIIEKATGRVIDVETGSQGYYVARALASGTYQLKVSRAGFTPEVVEGVIVQAGQTSNVNVTLNVGLPNEQVQVKATEAALQVDVSRHTVDGVVSTEKIVGLPVNGRNFLDVAATQPSVVIRDGADVDSTKSTLYRAVTVNSSSGTGTRVQIDGIDVTDEKVGTTTSNISLDAVEEFQLSRASFDLSTSLTTSGAVSVISRSGTNEFHGSAFYFFRNQDLGARLSYFENKVPFYRHQPGYRFGGPILKDKLFFFSSWENTYQATAFGVVNVNFPQLNGIVSQPLRQRLATNKLVWNPTNRWRLFYAHYYSFDDSTAGSSPAMPFQNLNWSNRHAVGADLTGAKATNSFRFGYSNFNNRIESRELAAFPFLRAPQGTPIQLNLGLDFNLGPNSAAPQQTYQDNFQTKYDGSYIRGDHIFRYGGEVNRIILGGFQNSSGRLLVNGTFTSAIQASLGNAKTDPLAYPFSGFSTGPNAGFFTVAPAHNLPHGGHFNTRVAGYFGDSWHVRRNLTLNLGTRWEYDTGFINSDVPSLPQLAVYGDPKLGEPFKFPFHLFSPQAGFAWDPKGDGKTSVRGGFYLSYEMNLFNNSRFDEFFRNAPGIGPESSSTAFVHGPNGVPIDIGPVAGFPNGFPNGNYSALASPDPVTGRPRSIRDVLGIIERVNFALKQAYENFQFDPAAGTPNFVVSKGVGPSATGVVPSTYKIPYAMQFSVGIQREIFHNAVLSADYVRIRGVGIPLILVDLERRFAARTLDAAAARTQVASVIGVPVASLSTQAIDTFLSTRPNANIGTFNLGTSSDNIFPGLTRAFTVAPIVTGGFTLYRGLQLKLEGRMQSTDSDGWLGRLFPAFSYTVSYALARYAGTNGSGQNEITQGQSNNDNFNQYFGPNVNDRTHILGAGVLLKVPFGFQVNQLWGFRTANGRTLRAPFLDTFSGTNGIFTTDLNGDGQSGDILPGTNIADFGRRINSWKQLNAVLSNFNANVAGTITPAGQALINAGIFTEAQMRRLGATVKPVKLVPETNPWPFSNIYNLDLRISRPIKIREKVTIEPQLDVFNAFNHTGKGVYQNLGGGFGSLNYDYVADPQGVGGIPTLTFIRDRNPQTRQLQLSMRISF